MVKKKLMDFTIEELVARATRGYGELDTEKNAQFNEERGAIKTAMDFKISQKQAEINDNLEQLTKRLVTLTKWLVTLTIGLIILTGIMLFRLD